MDATPEARAATHNIIHDSQKDNTASQLLGTEAENLGWILHNIMEKLHKRLEEEQDTAQPDLDLDKLLKEQIRYRGNQEQRQAKKEMVQHLQKTVLDQTQMQIDLHVRGRNQ